MAFRSAVVLLAGLALGFAQGAPDDAVLVQRNVVAHKGEPTPHRRWLGQRVTIEGYPAGKLATIVGYAPDEEYYNLLFDGQEKPLLDVDGRLIRDYAPPLPVSMDPHAGPIRGIKGFEFNTFGQRPYIVSKGNKPNSWNVYIPNHGYVRDLDDDSIVREKWWYKTSSTPAPKEPNMVAILTGKAEPRHSRTTEAPNAPKKKAAAKFKPTAPPSMKPEMSKDMQDFVRRLAERSIQEKEDMARAKVEAKKQAEDKKSQEVEAAMAKLVKEKRGRKMIVLELAQGGNGAGFTTQFFQGDGVHRQKEELLLVESIDDEGPLALWNKEHPRHALKVGDRILQVDGNGGNARKLEAEMLNIVSSGEASVMHLLAEKPAMTAAEVMEEVASSAQLIMDKGPMGFLREKLPGGIGKELINEKETVAACGDISSALLCGMAKDKFGLTCAGWTGDACTSHEELSCERISKAEICSASSQLLNLTCAGWGGSGCLAPGAPASALAEEEICGRAAEMGIEAAGWGGSACLAKDAKCSEITEAEICDAAQTKLGLSCLGWGGSSCLDQGAEVSLITEPEKCTRSQELFGIESAGWSGEACLTKAEAKCELINDADICKRAKKAMGIDCAGWGGSSCLPVGASPTLITNQGLCTRSKQALGIESGGWSGTGCLAPGNIKCADITAPGICNDSKSRLGIACGGWAGEACLNPGELKCNVLTSQGLCGRAAQKFGVPCVWNGDMCLPGQ